MTRYHMNFHLFDLQEPSCPLSYRYGIPCDLRVRNNLLEPPLSSRHPMGNRFGKLFTNRQPPVVSRGVTSQKQSPQVLPLVVEVPRPSSRQSGARPRHELPQGGGELSHGRRSARDRVHSNPQRVPSMKDVEFPPLPPPRTRAKSSVGQSSRVPSSYGRQASAGECDNGWIRVLSLTTTRALKGTSKPTEHEVSRP